MRTAEVFRSAGLPCAGEHWVSIAFSELKKWDSFKLFEADGTQVVDAKGHSIWVAASDPYIDAEGVLTIDTFVDNEP